MSKVILCLGMPRSGSTLQFNLIRNIISATMPLTVHGTVNEPLLSPRIQDLVDENDKTLHLIKSHTIDLATVKKVHKNLLIFGTYRDLRDIYLSFKEKVNLSLEEFITRTHESIVYYEDLESVTKVQYQKYEPMYKNPRKAVESILDFFEIKLSEERIETIISETSVEAAINLQKKFGWKNKTKHLINKQISSIPPGIRRRFICFPGLRKIRRDFLNPNIEDPNTLLHIDHISRFKGVPGTWQKALKPSEAARITKEFQIWLQMHGYPTN